MPCTQKELDFEARSVTRIGRWNWKAIGGGAIANEAWRWAGARSISIQISSEMPMQRFVALAALDGCLGVGLFGLANAYWQGMGRRA